MQKGVHLHAPGVSLCDRHGALMSIIIIIIIKSFFLSL